MSCYQPVCIYHNGPFKCPYHVQPGDKKMSEEVKVSPLDRLIAVQAELLAAQTAAQIKTANGQQFVVYGVANGTLNLYNANGQVLLVDRDRAKLIADSIYKILGEDE